MKKILVLLLAMLLLTGCGSNGKQGATTEQTAEDVGVKGEYVQISAEEAKKLMDTEENFILLDVRTPQEYREGHIPGSQNVPLQQLDKVEEVTENKDTVLYVYCRSGARSRQAVSLLNHMGYTNVHNIGGIAAYSGKVE